MKTLIVYYSLNGNTEQTAKTIAAELGADLLCIAPVKAYPDKGFAKFFWGGKSVTMKERPKLVPYDFRAADYERILFGTPVWASNFAPPLRTFIEENRAALQGKHFGAFVCMTAGGDEKTFRRLKEFLNIPALDAELALLDPKDNPNPGNAQKIKTFCDQLR